MKFLSGGQRAACVGSISSRWEVTYDEPEVFLAGHP